MLLMDDLSLYEKKWSFKDHGKSYEAVYRKQHPPGFVWLRESFGTNYRMTEIQAAIGLKQLEKLEPWVELRNKNAQKIYEALAKWPSVRIPRPSANIRHAYYKFAFFIRPEN